MTNLPRASFTGAYLFLVFLRIAVAHDLMPPNWRGHQGTTFQHWTFSDGNDRSLPEEIQNDYGAATATISVGAFGTGWLNQLPGFGTLAGYWDLGGAGGRIALDIDHDAQPNQRTEVCVQVTYFKDIHEVPTIEVPDGNLVSDETQIVEHVSTDGDWLLSQSTWRIATSPTSLTIHVDSNSVWGSVVDQVVVDARNLSTNECVVDFDDVSLFCAQWLSPDRPNEADLYGHDGVNFGDFSILAALWSMQCPADWPWP